MTKMNVLDSHRLWLKARWMRIGGSDAATVLGLNPYKTNVQLWREKTGREQAEDISDKPYVKYGTDAEEHLRALFAMDMPNLKVMYVANNMWENSEIPWAHASLDGWLEDEEGRRGILEIKTTNILQSMQREKWKDRIPDNYYCQILHYMAVTGFEFAWLKAQLKSEISGVPYLQTKHYYIDRADVEEDIKFLMEEERRFWEAVQADREPNLVLPMI